MEKQAEEISELHKRKMQEFTKQISEYITSIPGPIVNEKTADPTHPIAAGEEAKPKAEHSGHDTMPEIKSDVKETVTLDPTKQAELMYFVKQKSEEFKNELERMLPPQKNNNELALQKFSEELAKTVKATLDKKKYSFSN